MAYAPDGEGLQCDHCGHRLDVSEGGRQAGPAEEDFVLALATARGHARPQASPTFACGACGARFLLAAETLSLTCPYCDATYAIEASDEHVLIAPHAIVPLMISVDEARHKLQTWSRKAAGIGEELVIERLAAVHLPVWLFEMGDVIDWSAPPAGRGRGMDTGPLTGMEPPVSPIAVLACSRPQQGCAAAVEGMDPGLLVPYDPAYLAAWPAETYSLSLTNAALRARGRALRATEGKLTTAAGGLRLTLRSARLVVTSYRLA